MVTGSGRSRQDLLAGFVPLLTPELARPAGTERSSSHDFVEGSMLSADISGFTALSERMSAQGRIGAEQLSEIMSACFTGLIDAAASFGGDVLKFGGDALLVLFRGVDHQRRAALGAASMQHALAASAAARRSALTMSVGVAVGPFDVFVVGSERRELLVAGPAADRVIRLEGAAGRGEILVSSQIADAVGPTMVTGEHDDGFILDPDLLLADHVSEATPGDVPVAAAASDDLEQFVPPPVAGQLDAFAQLGGEHRVATVGFLMISGLNELIMSDPDDAATELGGIVDVVAATCDRLGVSPLETDISNDGFKFVLSAGAPLTHGDDSDALLRAALDIVGHDTRLQLRVGAQRGRVFAGFIGHPRRWTYSMTGDCMSTAARMLGKAPDRGVIAVDDAVSDTRIPLETEQLDPFMVKGKSAPITAHRVLGVDRTSTALASGSNDAHPLVGRVTELEQAIALLCGHPGRLDLVAGPGFGSTRLLDAVIASVSDGAERIIRVGVHRDTGEPYAPLRHGFRALLQLPADSSASAAGEALAELVAAHAPQLIDLLPLVGDVLGIDVPATERATAITDTFRRTQTVNAFVELLAAATETPDGTAAPIFAIDDAQWLDESSVSLLEAIVGDQRISCRVATTSRPDGAWTPPSAVRAIRLDALDDDHVRRIAIDRCARALSNSELDAVAERSGGNPLFAVELAQALEHSSDTELPDTIERLIASRIDELDPTARRMLRLAAVIGHDFDVATLTALLGLPDERAVVTPLETDLRGLLTKEHDDRWRFAQTVHRDVAYEGLPFRERRRLHGLVGDRLEASVRTDVGTVASALSIHWASAGRHERAWTFSVIAGDRAVQLSSPGDAIDAYERALQAASRIRGVGRRSRSRVATKLGDAAEVAGRYDIASAAYQRARRMLESDDPEQVPLFRKRGVVFERDGRYGQAIRWYERGLEAAERIDHADDHERFELQVAIGGVRFRQGRYVEAEQIVTSVATDITAPPIVRLRACYIAHVVLQHLGNRERQDLFGALGLELAALVDDPVLGANLTNNLGIAAYYDGNWDQAADLYTESLEQREAVGDLVGAVTSLNNLGELRSDQRRLDEARSLFERALRRATAAGYEMAIHVVRANLGRLATREGRADEARQLLTEALGAFEQMDSMGFVLESRLRMLEIDEQGSLDRAAVAALLDDNERHSGGATIEAPARRLAAAAARQAGDYDEARREAERALALSRESSLEAEVAVCLDELARIDLADGTHGTAASEAVALRSRLGIR